jgi:uncharacterized protein (UPF0548 family)
VSVPDAAAGVFEISVLTWPTVRLRRLTASAAWQASDVDLHALADLPFTYPEVGATAGPIPPGYNHLGFVSQIGTGQQRFEQAADAVMHWGMQRGAGLRVEASSGVVTVGTVVVVKLGFLPAPCRVVYVIDEPNLRGFAYGTLPGHPESGEERFAVRYDPVSAAVFAEVSSFSRPATRWSKVGKPLLAVGQRVIAKRYLRAV